MSQVFGVALPVSWTVARLKYVTSFLNRGSAPNYAESGAVRAISQAANQAGGIDWSRTRFHDFSGDPTKLKGYLYPDDILVNSTGTGTLGRVGYFSEDPTGYLCMADSHVTIIRTIRERLHSRFVYYWLNSRGFQDYLHSTLVVGATNQIELNRDRLADAPLPVPPWEEQKRIAGYLDVETCRIEKVASRFTQLDGLLKQRIFATVEGSLKHLLDGTGIRIKNLCRPVDKRAMGVADELSLLSVSIHAGVVPRSDFSDRESRSDSFENYKKCERGDIIVNRMRAFQGAVGITAMRGMVSPDYLVLRPGELVFPNFLHHLFRSRRFIGEMSSRIRGIGSISQGNVRTPRINWEDLADIRINVPDSTVQKQLVSELDEINSEMMYLRDRISRQLTLLAERRQALITAAVTGQFDISSASGRGVQRWP